ncbi:gamma-glutamyltransferase [Roseomonas sp. PWR1]|uniref:Gamma-glutamyltransferase n=1 Tax=Roseomonas nitratireducens TaxID=2820810 RepID=A0ABS4AZK0_9PROT|nr:gamma-glutamyltransferase [Neoroseomonas nitratireducens]MBP0466808.1 gamma-glutamyltransferase [Neoroseomonas nitratireducens]
MSTSTTTGASDLPMRATQGRRPKRLAAALLIGLGLALPGCSSVSSVVPGLGGRPQAPFGTPGHVTGFVGGAAADEPRAAIVAREILSSGGTAVDAAVAGAFAMTVTLPSRAGLGGGGACLVFNVRQREVIALSFPAGGRAGIPQGTDRPAAVPLMARGLFLLHTRGGRLRFEQLVRPAEDLARLGTEVSRAFATDLAAVAGPLLQDPQARRVFGAPGGGPLQAGERMTQLDLGATLAQLRTGGVGEMYQGQLAGRLEEGSATAGGGLTAAELRAARAEALETVRVPAGNDVAHFLPASIDGGAGTAAAFQAAMSGAAAPLSSGMVGASAGLVTQDPEGNAVACAFSMNNLFGTGRVVTETGILLAAAPNAGNVPAAPLAVALATNRDLRLFRAATAGSGQQAAGAAAGATLAAALRRVAPGEVFSAVPEPGRGLIINCPGFAPAANATCSGQADPRGGGVAIGSFAR